MIEIQLFESKKLYVNFDPSLYHTRKKNVIFALDFISASSSLFL